MALIVKVTCDGSGCDETINIRLKPTEAMAGNPVAMHIAKEGWVERIYCAKCAEK